MERADVKKKLEELETFLARFGDEQDMKVEVGNARFGYGEIVVKVTLREEGAESAEVRDYNQLKETNPLKYPELDSKSISGEYIIRGYKARNRKYPFLVQRADNGKVYKMSHIQFHTHFVRSINA